MPTISRFYGITIIMYYREGLNEDPHFHVKYAEYNAKISIQDLRIMKSKLPPRALGLVIEWASKHQEELMDNWKKIVNRESLEKIEPLK
ncbi:MAG: DUF4160 domain-containing protein [Bacteroidota bacterium]